MSVYEISQSVVKCSQSVVKCSNVLKGGKYARISNNWVSNGSYHSHYLLYKKLKGTKLAIRTYTTTFNEHVIVNERYNYLLGSDPEQARTLLPKLLRLETALENMDRALLEIKDIEHIIYREIVINGLGVTKAVERASEMSGKDVGTIWKYYYPKVKKELSLLKR